MRTTLGSLPAQGTSSWEVGMDAITKWASCLPELVSNLAPFRWEHRAILAPMKTERDQPKKIRVSELGEFVRFESCERRFLLGYAKQKAARSLPFYNRLMSPLDLILKQAGREAEKEWQRQLKDKGFLELVPGTLENDEEGLANVPHTPWNEFASKISTLSPGVNAYGREIIVEGRIGAFNVEGSIDFFLVYWAGDIPKLRLVEGKHSRKDRTYHRIQVVTYAILLKQQITANPLKVGGVPINPSNIEVAVARIQEDTGELYDLVSMPCLADFERELSDITRLLDQNGRLDRLLSIPIEEVDYELCGKCDGCTFNIHCLTESGRKRRLELLGISPSVSRLLRNEGVNQLDQLANLDLNGTVANNLRTKPGFSESLSRLKERAKARKSTLLNEEGDPDTFEVIPLPGAGQSQLPSYAAGSDHLVRIYLTVDYDYTENRVGAISAHIAHSNKELKLKWIDEEGKRVPDPTLYEHNRVEIRNSEGKLTGYRSENEGNYSNTQNKTIICVQNSPWTGNFAVDTGAEKSLLHEFFVQLVESIEEIVGEGSVCRLHFYLWNRNEMSHLIEACARADSKLLWHLRELLGSREGLEQLIFSSVGEEVERRYGLGWTGKGLIVAVSLGWFGQRYHWTRQVGRDVVHLDYVFTQDLFDFKTTLGLGKDFEWVKDREEAPFIHKFEIRSRNFDSLPAPYWRAVWGTMPPLAEGANTQLVNVVQRYLRANRKLLRSYLEARVHALRWIEEKCSNKNPEIQKVPVRTSELPNFSLGITNIGNASIDVLRLDGHVSASRWISAHLPTIRERVASGISLPLSNIELLDDRKTLTATINIENFDIDLEVAQANWDAGMFVRLTIFNGNPESSQTIRQLADGGVTGVIETIDWDSLELSVSALFSKSTAYVFHSAGAQWAAENMKFATLDESPSDFVSGRVENRILAALRTPAMRWFDPTNPDIPEAPTLDPSFAETIKNIVSIVQDEAGHQPDPTQVDAVMAGLSTRVHLLQGPPGTGKTATTALGIFARILARRSPGDIILIASNTHTAVNELVSRLVGYRDEFEKRVSKAGQSMPVVRIGRVKPNELGIAGADFQVEDSAIRLISSEQRQGVVILAGVTNGLLKLQESLASSRKQNFIFNELIVDEASMLVFPHFLALASLIDRDGMIGLTGDNRQLAPILAHQWDREDRPPIETYQPHISAYDAIATLCSNAALSKRSVYKSALSITFRLPPRVVNLIARVYAQDQIRLQGVRRGEEIPATLSDDPWQMLWTGNVGLFLVVHDERESRKINAVEVEIAKQILTAAPKEDRPRTAVVTPHRAQKHLLQQVLRNMVGLVDTVERLQGGQRKNIIVSGCASDPGAITSTAEFILDIKRSNVAFSRVQDRLIVVCAQTLLDAVPSNIEDYDSAMLWKALRETCSQLLVASEIKGHTVRLFSPVPVSTAAKEKRKA